jgi:PBSX family phage portal protein
MSTKIQEGTNKLIKATVIENTMVPSNYQMKEAEAIFDYGAGVYETPYDLTALLKFPEYSNILAECIDAYKNNITGFGWEIVPKIDTNSIGYDKKLYEIALKQKATAEVLFNFCNYKSSFTALTKKLVDNRERNGNGYLEVIENLKGEPAGFEFVESSKIRILKPKGLVDKKVTARDETGKEFVITMPVRFYRYVQNDNGSRLYYKEYGDPRIMNKATGEYEEDLPEEERASCLLHFKIECIYSVYGVPRYIGKTPSIVGSRKSEELNIQYFDNGRIVPAAIMIENGQLTEESYDKISNLKGLDKAFKFLLLEAEPFSSDDSIVEGESKTSNHVKIEVKPLTELIQQDGLFQDYDKNNRNKVRAGFRIPPIYTGESQDYSKSTAQTARSVAEALVFEPERQEISEPFNRIIRDLGLDLVEFRFKSPKLTDKYELSKALVPYINSGAATPNTLVVALGELLGTKVNVIEEEWGDLPLEIALKKLEIEAVANRVTGSLDDGKGNISKSKYNVQKSDVAEVLKEVLQAIRQVTNDESK